MTPARLAALVLTACALALAAAACGGEGGPGGAAEVLPASAAVVVTVSTDVEGEQWQAAEELVRRFPDGERWLATLLEDLDGDVDFDRDVQPAFGPVAALALLDTGEDGAYVLVTEPRDPDAFRRLMTERGEKSAVRDLGDGWWGAAETDAILDRLERAREDGPLSGSDDYGDAVGGLPEDALATVYVSGAALAARAASERGAESPAVECLSEDGAARALAFAARAEDDGFRVEGTVLSQGAEPSGGGVSNLADTLPAGPLLVVGMSDLAASLEETLRCATERDEDFARQLAQVELATGVSVQVDLLPLFRGETVVAAYEPERPANALRPPTVALVTEVENESEALAVFDRLAGQAGAFLPLTVEDVFLEDRDGVVARVLKQHGEPVLFFGAADGVLVLSNTRRGLETVGTPDGAERLSESEPYRAAREAAGAPDAPDGLVYADLGALVEAFMGFAAPPGEAGGLPPLEPLGPLFLWSDVGGDGTTVEGFVGID